MSINNFGVSLPVKIFPARADVVSPDVAVGGEHDELIGGFDKVDSVAVLGFDFVEGCGVVDDVTGAALVVLSGGKTHFHAVLLEMLLKPVIVAEVVF